MECADIAVAVLAAGRATRFGSDKLIAPLNGMPMGAHIAHTLAPMGFGWRFAVCASDAPIGAQYAAMGFDIIENSTPESGQAHSLHLALAAAERTGAAALLIVLADMPFVTSEHIARVAAQNSLAASHNGSISMPPALFPRDCWAALLATSGDRGATALLREARLVAARPEELRDIDLPADLPRPQA